MPARRTTAIVMALSKMSDREINSLVDQVAMAALKDGQKQGVRALCQPQMPSPRSLPAPQGKQI